jgi:hypothetical protein
VSFYGQDFDDDGRPIPAAPAGAAEALPQQSAPDEEKGKGPSQASVLRTMALERYRFVAGEDGTPWAVPKTGARVARPFRGGRLGLRAELARLYADRCKGAVPSASALADAMTALEGEAQAADPVHMATRVTEHRGQLYLDLGSADGKVVRVTAGGWRVLGTAPEEVLFRRTALTSPLPEPTHGGDLQPLRSRLNVTEEDWPLALAWLVAALIPSVPHPVLVLLGEQGTGKSTATRLLVNLIDPSPAPLRSGPRDVESWAVTASASWVIGLDNLSAVPQWLSDLLCKAVTGDGLVRRQLFTDGDVSVLAFRRVIACNGIDLGALRGDLADRMLGLQLERITADKRRTEAAVAMTQAETARVLGALLDLAAEVLAVLPDITLAEMPRMADFARVLAAVDKVAGYAALERYTRQAADLASAVVESDPFAAAVVAWMDKRAEWSGTGGQLFGLIPVPDPRPKSWPADGQRTNAALRRVAPALRSAGDLAVSETKDPRTRRTMWTLASQSPPTDQPSQASQASYVPVTSGDAAKPGELPGFGPTTAGFGTPGQDTAPKPAKPAAKPADRPGFAPQPMPDQREYGAAKPPKPPKPDSRPLSAAEPGLCSACGEPMTFDDGSGTHPGCEVTW